MSEDREEGFLIGWLDAIWSAFSVGKGPRAPEEIQRQLIRMGWLKPEERFRSGKPRPVTITPLGIKTVIQQNIDSGIDRTILDENDKGK